MKVKCRCRCHTNKKIKHVMTCCNNGYKEFPDIKKKFNETNSNTNSASPNN